MGPTVEQRINAPLECGAFAGDHRLDGGAVANHPVGFSMAM